jgi:hypothetical protein
LLKRVDRPLRTKAWLSLLMIVVALLLIGVTPATLQAQSGITSPAGGSTIAGDVPIVGTAVIESFQRYEVYYKLEPSSNDAYIYFDGGTNQVTNGQLAIWRTANLPPGTYSIRLRVVKADGNYGEFFAEGLVLGQSSTEPTPTPTSSEPTPTSIPTATFTPAPQPTPIVGQITQPRVEGETAAPALVPTATSAGLAVVLTGATGGISITAGITDGAIFDAAAPASQEVTTSFTRDLGEAVGLNQLRSFFVTGIQLSATLILGCVVLLAGKRLFSWLWTQYR